MKICGVHTFHRIMHTRLHTWCVPGVRHICTCIYAHITCTCMPWVAWAQTCKKHVQYIQMCVLSCVSTMLSHKGVQWKASLSRNIYTYNLWCMHSCTHDNALTWGGRGWKRPAQTAQNQSLWHRPAIKAKQVWTSVTERTSINECYKKNKYKRALQKKKYKRVLQKKKSMNECYKKKQV